MKVLFSLLSRVIFCVCLFTLIGRANGSEELKFDRVSTQILSTKDEGETFTINGKLFDQKKISIEAIDSSSLKEGKDLLGASDTIVKGFVLYCRVLKSNNFAFALNNLMSLDDPNVSSKLISFYKEPEYVKNVVSAASNIESIEPVVAVLSESGIVYLYARILTSDYTIVNAIAMKEVKGAWVVVPSMLSDEKNKTEMKIFDSLAREIDEKVKVIDFKVISPH